MLLLDIGLLALAVAQLVGHQACNVGSSPGHARLHSGLGQATYTCVALSPCSVIYNFRPVVFCSWEDNRRSDVALTMHHRQANDRRTIKSADFIRRQKIG